MRPILKTILLASMQLVAGYAGNAIFSDAKSNLSIPTVIICLIFIFLYVALYYRDEQKREILMESVYSDVMKEILPEYTKQATKRLKNGEPLRKIAKELVDANQILKRLKK